MQDLTGRAQAKAEEEEGKTRQGKQCVLETEEGRTRQGNSACSEEEGGDVRVGVGQGTAHTATDMRSTYAVLLCVDVY